MIKYTTKILYNDLSNPNQISIVEIKKRIDDNYESLRKYDESCLLSLANQLSVAVYGYKEGWNHLKTIIIHCKNTECVHSDVELLIKVIKHFDSLALKTVSEMTENEKKIELNDDDIRHIFDIIRRKEDNYATLKKKSIEELNKILEDISQWSMSLVNDYNSHEHIKNNIWYDYYMNASLDSHESFVNLIKEFDSLLIKEGYIYEHYDMHRKFDFRKYKNPFCLIENKESKNRCVVHGTVKEINDEE